MSIHSSLKKASTMKRHRSVLSRLERVKLLQQRGVLVVEESSLLGLPKVKHLRIRVRKEKAAAPATATSGGGEGTGATTGASAAASPQTASKPASKVGAGPSKPEAGTSSKKKE